jgi:tetratricopeptide (TPR) repeat protein
VFQHLVERNKTMFFSATVVATALLNALASAAPIGNFDSLDKCRTSDSDGKSARCADVLRANGETTPNRVFADSRHGIEMVRLDPKDPDARRDDATKAQARSDLNQIIVYYNAAISHDPKDDDAYFHRGIARFYAGDRSQALADLGQASKLDPAYPYYALWIDIIDQRRNAASRLPQAISHIDMTRWPAPVIRLFLGQTTPAVVLAAAEDADAATKRGQVCEANFYSGELALQHGAKAEAARLFRLAAAGCTRDFVEGSAGGAELNALDGNP